jgi:ribose-phosphate pyrophosphokinase
MRAPLARVKSHRFPDGETLVRVAPPAGNHALLVRSLFDPNAKIIETLLAADALRRSGARRVTLVAPYMPYMRQDKVFRQGEPISQRVIGKILGEHFDSVLTLEPHLHRVRNLAEVVPGRARSLSAVPAIVQWLRRTGRDILVVGPDEESQRWVAPAAKAVGAPHAIGEKVRRGDRSVRVHFEKFAPCRRAVIVDDIASSGVTLAATARALRAAGIARVEAIVIHAIFAPGGLALIRRAGVSRIVSCDTVPHPTNAIRTARIFAAALTAVSRK